MKNISSKIRETFYGIMFKIDSNTDIYYNKLHEFRTDFRVYSANECIREKINGRPIIWLFIKAWPDNYCTGFRSFLAQSSSFSGHLTFNS